MVPHLRMIADSEKLKIDDDALEVIALHADGSLRDAETALDQVRHTSADTITREDAEATLGSIASTRVEELLSSVQAHDAAAVSTTLAAFESEGVSAVSLAREINTRILEGTPNLETLGLLDSLLEVPKSYSPGVKLFAVLMRASIGAKQPVAPKLAALVVPTPIVREAPVAPVKKGSAKPESGEKQPEPVPETPLATTHAEPFDWDSLVGHAKQNFIVLHSVLSKCQYTFDGDTLTIYSKFKLHKTKLDDAKYRAMLDAALKELTGAQPTVSIIFGAKPIDDENLADIAALMGGGEEVHVSEA